ncbi:F-box only protein 39 [Elysia marginata]|uniref:F-box only protein 39 n=1 Tax=Elysia marginata TaxID=1093978 RepID=A0AAV4HAV0_9GAST|nr:F-box only protein 39 [Elysia marginata]
MSRVTEFCVTSGPQHLRHRRLDFLTTDQRDLIQPSTSNRYDNTHSQTDALTIGVSNENKITKRFLSTDREGDDNNYNSDQDRGNRCNDLFPLFSLPTDTLLRVFSFLKKNDQLRMSGVCRSWRQLIFTSACLWRKRQMVLRCSRQSSYSRSAFFYARRLGRYLHKLSVTCDHPNNHACRAMALSFRRLMTALKVPPSLRSFKVTELRLSHARASVLLDISACLERFVYSLGQLKCFQMSNAHWPAQEGLRVISSVLTSCQDSLHTLRIDGFFLPRFVPPTAVDVLTPGLAYLTCLRKLSISYFYLNEQTILTLASTRPGQLRSLRLVACDVSPNLQFVSKTAWLALQTKSCPSLRVEFVVEGFTVSPSVSLPRLLCPVLRVHKLNLNIGNRYTYLDTPRLNMAAVLAHVTRHFRRRLTRFELDVDNHSDRLDTGLVKLVRRCRHLVSVKVKAYFNNPETDVTLRQILRSRREKHAVRETERIEASVSTGTERVTRTGDVTTEENGGMFGGLCSGVTSADLTSEEASARVSSEIRSNLVTEYPNNAVLPESRGSGRVL